MSKGALPKKGAWMALFGAVATVMAILGIPGLLPLIERILEPELADVVFCEAEGAGCSDMLLDEDPAGNLITANRLTLARDMAVPPGTVIVANEIDLGGRTLTASSDIAIFAREARNGTVRVIDFTDELAGDGHSEQLAGLPGGRFTGVFGAARSSLVVDASGEAGTTGKAGSRGGDGQDGECGPFDFEGNDPGEDGEAGSDGGRGGDAGSIRLVAKQTSADPTVYRTLGGVGGAGGQGGAGGRGGDGCVGLGGTQERDVDGRSGQAGSKGDPGLSGARSISSVSLRQLIRFSRKVQHDHPTSLHEARALLDDIGE